jgi:ribose transport system permease protein
MRSFLAAIVSRPWIYGFIVAFVMWIVTTAYSGLGSGGAVFSAAMEFAVFSVVVGTGQMLVIASGPGNIDLSIPSVLTLAAYVSMSVMRGHNGLILPGLLVALAVGATAGALNFSAIIALRLPPMIATLAWSFVFQSLAFNLGGEVTVKPPDGLSWFTAWRIGDLQVLPLVIIVLTLVIMVLQQRTIYGRQLLATGQSEAAAWLAGIAVRRVRLIAYMASGLMAGLAGFLISGFTGGAALDMGDTYLMESIAVVVLGGTSVTGGQANAVGIWGAALFFNLMATMLNTFHLDVGVRFLFTGALIVLIVVIVPRPRAAY